MLNTTKTIGKKTLTFNSEAYNHLLCQYQPHIITNEEDNEKFLAIVEELMSRPSLTSEEETILDLLVKLIEDFEESFYSLNSSTPHSRLLHLMEARNLEKIDLLNFLASKDINIDFFEGNVKITRQQANILADFFNVKPDLFLDD